MCVLRCQVLVVTPSSQHLGCIVGHRCASLLRCLQVLACFPPFSPLDSMLVRCCCCCPCRTLLRKYIPFLNIHSRVAMQSGASKQQLAAAEDRLGLKLPWEVRFVGVTPV